MFGTFVNAALKCRVQPKLSGGLLIYTSTQWEILDQKYTLAIKSSHHSESDTSEKKIMQINFSNQEHVYTRCNFWQISNFLKDSTAFVYGLQTL